jgi:ribosomal protein L17
MALLDKEQIELTVTTKLEISSVITSMVTLIKSDILSS